MALTIRLKNLLEKSIEFARLSTKLLHDYLAFIPLNVKFT